MRAYHEVYLDEIVETQGRLFEEAPSYFAGELDVTDFIVAYMNSEARARIDRGDPYVCTKDAVELWEFFQKTSSYVPKTGSGIGGFIPNWIGQFYAYFQWYYNIPSSKLITLLPVQDMLRRYPGLHDLDLSLAVTKIGGALNL